MTGSMSKITTVADIPVELIDVMPGRRRLDPTWVETLSDLFSGQGQQTPIELVAAGERFRLIFGNHRLAAARMIGWKTVQAVVKSPEDFADEAEITLREITENLARRQLSALDKAVDIARWREAYEAANGAVKPGRKAKLSQDVTISDDAAERFAETFSVAARKAFGLDRMAISRATRIATIASPIRDRIALHAIADNQSELLQLAAEPAERQEGIVALLTSEPPQAASIAEAVAILDRLPAPARQSGWQKLSDAFSRLKTRDQERFFELHYAAITIWLEGRDD